MAQRRARAATDYRAGLVDSSVRVLLLLMRLSGGDDGTHDSQNTRIERVTNENTGLRVALQCFTLNKLSTSTVIDKIICSTAYNPANAVSIIC